MHEGPPRGGSRWDRSRAGGCGLSLDRIRWSPRIGMTQGRGDEGRRRKTMHEGPPRGGSRWGRPKAGGCGLCARPPAWTPAARLRRRRPARMASQETSPC